MFIRDVNPEVLSESVMNLKFTLNLWLLLRVSDSILYFVSASCMWCVRDSLDLCSVLFQTRLLLKIPWNHLKSAVFFFTWKVQFSFLLCWHIFPEPDGTN